MGNPPKKPQTGRPSKKQDIKTFQVAVPINLYLYLEFLARNSFVGGDAAEVASFILITEARRMAQENFHDLRVPRDTTGDAPDDEAEQ